MNKKLLGLAITLIFIALLSTLMVGTVEACRWRKRPQLFEATFQLRNPESQPYSGGVSPPTSTEYFGPIDPEWVNPDINPDGYKYFIMKGLAAWGTIDCGPLGIGKMTFTQKWWFNNFETLLGVTMVDILLEFDGEYGDYEGTISGVFWLKTDGTTHIAHIVEGKGMFFEGTGDFEGVKIIATENHSIDLTQLPLIINGEFTGRIWGSP